MTEPTPSTTENLRETASALPPVTGGICYGYYPWWPEEGDDWLHPDDVALARSLLPSPRIWRREPVTIKDTVKELSAEPYVAIHYGELCLHVRKTLWLEVEYEGLDLDHLVEVLPHGMKNDPQIGHIREMHWQPHRGKIGYQIRTARGTPLETWFHATDLKRVDALREVPDFYVEPTDDPGYELGDVIEEADVLDADVL